MDINLIGVPLFYGSDKKGVEKGPNVLRQNGILNIIRRKNCVYDMGDIYIKQCDTENKYVVNENAKYLDEIVDANINLANNVFLTHKDNRVPIIIGGDHSLALGSIAGTSRFYKRDLAVIWIDAHGDFNTDTTTPSGNIHGMPLAASAGLGLEDLRNLYFDGKKVDFENIYIIGARDLDSGEIKLLKENKINYWSNTDIVNFGIRSILDKVIKNIEKNNINNIHLSFDIDSVDPKFAPGTGTPVNNGISVDEAIETLSTIIGTKKVRTIDFVEFNPILDLNNVTLNNCLKIIDNISSKLAEVEI